jgi:hypothetical protein
MNIFILVSELSYYLQIKRTDFLNFIREEGLDNLLTGRLLNYDDLPKILSIYSSKHGFSKQKCKPFSNVEST